MDVTLSMTKKKVFLLLFSLIFMGLFSGVVFATHTPSHRDTFLPEIVEKTARFLFLDLGALSKTAPDTFVLYTKFIFFILVFSIFYWGISKGMPSNTRIGGTIAFLFALIGTVMLPGSYMIFLFETYAQVIGFIFGILPFIIGLIISHTAFKGEDTWQRILRGVVYILMGVFTFALVGTLRGFEDTLYIELAKWAEIGGFISMIVGVMVLIGSMGGSVGAGTGAKGIWERLTGGNDREPGTRTPSVTTSPDGTSEERERARVEEEAEEAAEGRIDRVEITEEKKLFKEQNDTLRKLMNMDATTLNPKAVIPSQSTFKGWMIATLEAMEENIENLKKLQYKEIKLEHLREQWLKKYAVWSRRNEIAELLDKDINKEIKVLERLEVIHKDFKEFVEKLPGEKDPIDPNTRKEAKKYINLARGLTGLLIEVNVDELRKLNK